MRSYYTCEHVITERGKVEYCNNMAQFISPPGVHTGRVIKVCVSCRKQITNYYKTLNKTPQFTKIEYTPESYEKAGVPGY